jgi:hypothetical protein
VIRGSAVKVVEGQVEPEEAAPVTSGLRRVEAAAVERAEVETEHGTEAAVSETHRTEAAAPRPAEAAAA